MKLIYLGLFLLCFSMAAQENTNDLKLYPNPAYGETVEIVTTDKSPKVIVVYDVFGKIVLNDRITSNKLNIGDLQTGIYLLQIQQGQERINRKLIVK